MAGDDHSLWIEKLPKDNAQSNVFIGTNSNAYSNPPNWSNPAAGVGDLGTAQSLHGLTFNTGQPFAWHGHGHGHGGGEIAFLIFLAAVFVWSWQRRPRHR